MNWFFIGLIVVSVLFETVADIFFRKWALDHKTLLVVLGMALYVVSTAIWAYSLKFEYLSRAIGVFTILNFILVALAGFILFKEDLSLVNKIGIALGLVSLILIEY